MTGLRRRILDRLLRRREQWQWVCVQCDRRSPIFATVGEAHTDKRRHDALCHEVAPAGFEPLP